MHGRVRLARDAASGERVAVKIVPREVRRKLGDRQATTPLTDEKVLREIAIMKKCQHPNVVQLKEVIDDPHSRKIFMVLEYMERGEIEWKDYAGRPTMTVDETRRTFRDVVLGLEFLHYQGIVHRDIKPANLLWDADCNVKISDFGVSHLSLAPRADAAASQANAMLDEAALAKTAGSPAFFAPELCLCGDGGVQLPITKAIDVWALGVTLYCLLFGHPPFMAETEYALFGVIPYDDYVLPTTMGADEAVIGPRGPRWAPRTSPGSDEEQEDALPPPPPVGSDVPPDTLSRDARLVRDLLDRLLEKDPRKRITLDGVKQHPWIVQNLPDADDWLHQTDPALEPSVQVSQEEVVEALTGLPRLKQNLKRLQSRLAGSLYMRRTSSSSSGASTLSEEPWSPTSSITSRSETATPGSATSAHSFANASRLFQRVPLVRTATLPARRPQPSAPPIRTASMEHATTEPPTRSASRTSLWLAPGTTETHPSVPSAVTLEPAMDTLRVDDYDHDLSDDDLDEDVVSHSSSSRRTVDTVSDEPRARDT